MLAQVAHRQIAQVSCLQGDIDDLPLREKQYDLIFSNLAMQWSADLGSCLKQLKRILNDGGRLHFSTLISGTLDELTQAWQAVDHHPHTNTFISLETIKKLLQACDFKNVNIKTEARTLHYNNVLEVMRALKRIGANHVHGQQGVTVKGRKLLSLLEKGYAPFINEQGELSLTYQVCYVQAEK
jgi:malonyl-CoA O-methyltransferase